MFLSQLPSMSDTSQREARAHREWDNTRSPFDFNNRQIDAFHGLRQSGSDYLHKCLSRIHIDVDDLAEDVVIGIKVRRESVTLKTVHLFNLVKAGIISLDEQEYEDAVKALDDETSEISRKAQALITAEQDRRATVEKLPRYPDNYISDGITIGRHGN
jgi:hypothetical protein